MEWRGGKLPDSDFELEGRVFAVWPYATCAVCSQCEGTQTTLTLNEARKRWFAKIVRMYLHDRPLG